ncbi:hypothetical protein ACFVW9_14505 [Streptomyces sp. NPDC058217]|uniref:hypothetical protein n=1 Tax=Streptomyces sp. NPDC058217 TaxID=3346384 RepID=UPI0036E43403
MSRNSLYGFKHPAALRFAGRASRLRSASPGGLPGSARGAAPAFGPLGPGCADARVVAQMVNYHSHAKDSGFTGDIPPTFFAGRARCSRGQWGGADARAGEFPSRTRAQFY